MADYYPLLSKAISGLPSNTLETRHAIYDRARTALLRQLASIDPPVAQAIVDRELGALEQVFTRLEMENLEVAAEQASSEFEIAPFEETIAPVTNTRPQVHSVKKTESTISRKPVLAVGFALAAVLVFTLATLAFLRRDVPPVTSGGNPVVAQRTPVTAPNAEAASNAPKASDRVGVPTSSETAAAQIVPTIPAPTPAVSSPPAVPTPAPTPVPTTTPVASTPAPATPAPATPPQTPTAPPAISVANRAVLLVQNSEKQEDVTLRQGSVVWRNEVVSSAQSQISDRSIKAVVDIPEAKFQMEVTIQRNRDAAFPASHTIQVRSIPAAGSDIGNIQGISTFEFRQVENQTGYSMAGQGIAVVDNLFLIALSNVEPALSRNVEMMKSRPLAYLEFPLANGRRGAVLLDKGISGQQAFDAAFSNWQ